MADGQKNLFPLPTGTEIAQAAKQAIRSVKADFPDVDDLDFCKLIGATSTKTIERLEKMETQKVPASLFAGIARKRSRHGLKRRRGHVEQQLAQMRAAFNSTKMVIYRFAPALTDLRSN